MFHPVIDAFQTDHGFVTTEWDVEIGRHPKARFRMYKSFLDLQNAHGYVYAATIAARDAFVAKLREMDWHPCQVLVTSSVEYVWDSIASFRVDMELVFVKSSQFQLQPSDCVWTHHSRDLTDGLWPANTWPTNWPTGDEEELSLESLRNEATDGLATADGAKASLRVKFNSEGGFSEN